MVCVVLATNVHRDPDLLAVQWFSVGLLCLRLIALKAWSDKNLEREQAAAARKSSMSA